MKLARTTIIIAIVALRIILVVPDSVSFEIRALRHLEFDKFFTVLSLLNVGNPFLRTVLVAAMC